MNARFLCFWSINAPLHLDSLLQQVRAMREAGFDGVVWHPRSYPNQPEYLSLPYMRTLSRVILEARELGLAFWLYDEDGWPSGTVGGRLPRLFPHLRNQVLAAQATPGDRVVATIHRDAAGRRARTPMPGGDSFGLAVHQGSGLNYFDPAATARFLEMTHDAYARDLDPQAFAHVEAVFSDEPEFGLTWLNLPQWGAVPWNDDLPEHYRHRTGRDLLDDLPLLFVPGEGDAAARVAFWELAVDRLAAGFLRPYQQWCDRHGKRLTVHFKGEEHPLFQLPNMTSLSQALREVSMPGFDALERMVTHDLFPRQVASVARQFSDGSCMAECFGGAGWGASPADLQRYLARLIAMGATDLVCHLWQYELTDAARRDWPPSHPAHMTWREVMPALLATVRRDSAAALARFAQADTLLVVPSRAVAARYEPWQLALTNVHDARCYPDTPASRLSDATLRAAAELAGTRTEFHVTDERTWVEHGRSTGTDHRLGRCAYRRVVVVDGCLLDKVTLRSGADEIARAASEWHGRPRWQVQRPENRLVLDVLEPSPLARQARFTIAAGARPALRLHLLSEPIGLRFNGQTLPPAAKQATGWAIDLPIERLGDENHLAWDVHDDAHSRGPAYAALHGEFRVAAGEPWQADVNDTLVQRGPLWIEPAGTIDPSCCVASGYPFWAGPFLAQAELEASQPWHNPVLTFLGVAGDALRVWVDDRDLGWCWAPEWSVSVPDEVSAGRHTVRLELVGSTYNVYGPHHYVYGDRHVISPDQFSGTRNYADPIAAPAHTLDTSWRVRPVRFPRLWSLTQQEGMGK
jgi:hypothetical protein